MPQGPLDLLSLRTVATMLDLNPKTVLAMWERGELPDPIDLGHGARRQLRWYRAVIEAKILSLKTVKPDKPGGK